MIWGQCHDVLCHFPDTCSNEISLKLKETTTQGRTIYYFFFNMQSELLQVPRKHFCFAVQQSTVLENMASILIRFMPLKKMQAVY